MPKAAYLLGFEIGFQFQKAAAFENGIKGFPSKHPCLIMDVPELLRRQREGWQKGLVEFRNDFLEHRSLEDRCGGEVLQARMGGNGVRFRLAHDG